VLALGREVLPGVNDSWKGLLEYAQIGEGLVVFEQYVVLGLILLDEIVFKQERVKLSIGQRELEVPDF
jgi:hypothetical protein